jgi:murein DD-endopeptidase MepM/ murein hydrolase activator NlpD
MATWKHPFSKSTITSVFGTMVRRTSPHRGTDYAPGAYDLIPAITKGRVVTTAWSSCLGWYMVQTAWAEGKTWYLGYCHLACNTHGVDCKGPKQHPDGSNNFVSLKVGDRLELGQWVGRVGNTGSCSKGSHVHITLGTNPKSVTSGQVYDLAAFIDSDSTPSKPPISKRPKAKPKPVEVCECCERPL